VIAQLFATSTPLWLVVVRTAVVYVAVVLGLRLTGKRQLGQPNTLDLVAVLLAANGVQNAMTGPDTSVTVGIVSTVTLFALNALWTRYGPRLGIVQQGTAETPTLLVTDGVVQQRALRREGLTREELDAALRAHGLASVGDVKRAVLEVDGSISVIPADQPSITTPPHVLRSRGAKGQRVAARTHPERITRR
jgi:uncharacterized membrane protein YcaP (DUF421 family)